jgi:hypothetical protein
LEVVRPSTPDHLTYLIASVYMAIGSTLEGVSRLRRMHLQHQCMHIRGARGCARVCTASNMHIHMHARPRACIQCVRACVRVCVCLSPAPPALNLFTAVQVLVQPEALQRRGHALARAARRRRPPGGAAARRVLARGACVCVRVRACVCVCVRVCACQTLRLCTRNSLCRTHTLTRTHTHAHPIHHAQLLKHCAARGMCRGAGSRLIGQVDSGTGRDPFSLHDGDGGEALVGV